MFFNKMEFHLTLHHQESTLKPLFIGKPVDRQNGPVIREKRFEQLTWFDADEISITSKNVYSGTVDANTSINYSNAHMRIISTLMFFITQIDVENVFYYSDVDSRLSAMDVLKTLFPSIKFHILTPSRIENLAFNSWNDWNVSLHAGRKLDPIGKVALFSGTTNVDMTKKLVSWLQPCNAMAFLPVSTGMHLLFYSGMLYRMPYMGRNMNMFLLSIDLDSPFKAWNSALLKQTLDYMNSNQKVYYSPVTGDDRNVYDTYPNTYNNMFLLMVASMYVNRTRTPNLLETLYHRLQEECK